MKKSIAFFLNTILAGMIFVLQMHIIEVKHHTLYYNGNWGNKKTESAKYLIGAHATLQHPRTIKDGKLDLTSWFCNNWFSCNRLLDFDTIAFTYINPRKFSFIINDDSLHSVGLTLHSHGDTSGFFFVATKAGKFEHCERLNLRSITFFNTAQNKVIVTRHDSTLSIMVNGKTALTTIYHLPAKLKIGFRGYTHPVLIDNVVTINKQGIRIFAESFGYTHPISRFAWLLWPVFTLLLIWSLPPFSFWIRAFTFIHFLFALCCTFWAIQTALWAQNYPSDKFGIEYQPVNLHLQSEDEIISSTCGRLTACTNNARRTILFIGSSQTWGAGVSDTNLTIPAQINTSLHDSALAVINGGIPGLEATRLYSIYTKHYLPLKPYIVVINLSHNDTSTALFGQSIAKFITTNKQRNIKTLLVTEPCMFEETTTSSNHSIMKRIADYTGTPINDMHPYIHSCEDSGFIWWDNAHLTEYGYTLFAQHLAPSINKLLIEKEIATPASP